ncbi:MAG: hypothetical protein CV088_16065 [Nitrospira sp. LK70]|nr:hypothetical protein [Nitrospira sp. LK70]
MLRITADVFSGRTNPEWTMDTQQAQEILRELSSHRVRIGKINEGFDGLGYRGLIVDVLSDNLAMKYDLPHTFRLAHNNDSKGLELGERILGSMRRAEVIEENIHTIIMKEFQKAKLFEDDTEADRLPEQPHLAEKHVKAAVTCFIERGAFNPGFWNDPAHIGRNNCYNYASNRRTDTFAQPGRATGHQATIMDCSHVTTGALSDGLHHRFDCFPDSEKPRWLMALVIAPGYDYHWYRSQKEGFWGHKPGGTAARNVDNNGAIVWNPETAARGPYTQFCGYFYACKSQKIN